MRLTAANSRGLAFVGAVLLTAGAALGQEADSPNGHQPALLLQPPKTLPTLPPSKRVAQVEELRIYRQAGACAAFLDNGVRVLHRKMDDEPGAVSVCCTLYRRQSNEAADRNVPLFSCMAGLLRHPACGQIDREGLEQVRDRRGIALEAGADPATLSVSFSCPVASLPDALAMVRCVLLDPRISDQTLEEWRERAAEPRPRNARRDLGFMVIGDGLARCALATAAIDRLPTAGEAAGVAAEDATSTLARLAATAPMEVGIAGDLSREDAMRIVARELGDLPARERPDEKVGVPIREVGRGACPIKCVSSIASPNGHSYAFVGFAGPDLDRAEEYRAIIVGVMAIEERLRGNLRDAGVNIHATDAHGAPGHSWSTFGTFGLAARVDADGARNAADLMRAELEGAVSRPLTQAEIDAVIKKVLTRVESLIRSPSYWAEMMSRGSFSRFDPDVIARAVSDYSGVRADRVVQLLKTYDVPTSGIEVIVPPAPR